MLCFHRESARTQAILNPMVESFRLWEPSMGTSHRLPEPVYEQQLDKQNYRGN
jgi:hypothetical protein